MLRSYKNKPKLAMILGLLPVWSDLALSESAKNSNLAVKGGEPSINSGTTEWSPLRTISE